MLNTLSILEQYIFETKVSLVEFDEITFFRVVNTCNWEW